MSVKTIPEKTKATRKTPRVKVSVRLAPDIHKRVSQIAAADQRSFSQVVELILARSLGKGSQQSAPGPEDVEQDDPALSGYSLLSRLSQSAPHGSWSQHDDYEAAANLQALLDEQQAGTQ